jgi:hypothetical protein
MDVIYLFPCFFLQGITTTCRKHPIIIDIVKVGEEAWGSRVVRIDQTLSTYKGERPEPFS